MSRHVMSHLAPSCHVMPRHVMSRHVTSCHVMLRHITSKVAGRSHDQRFIVNWLLPHAIFKLSMTVFVGCPEGCRYHTASAVYDLVFFIFLFYFFYSPFVLRNYSTDCHQISRDCVFWCSLNNPIVLKFFWRHLAEKNVKNRKNVVKISRVDSNFWQ